MITIQDPPQYRSVRYDLRGMTCWQQVKHVIRNPPRMELLVDWIIIFPDELQIIIPRGFITDGASVPKWLWWLIAPFGPLLEGALVHDFGYQYGYLLAVHASDQPYNIRSLELRHEYVDRFGEHVPVYISNGQQFFDNLLEYIAIEINGATVQAKLAKAALRFFGHVAWGRYRNRGPAAYNSNSLGLPGVDSRGRTIAP